MALFDNDPFSDVLDPWKQLGRRPTSPIQPFQPAEEQSVLGKLARGGMGGLAYLGSSLDKAFGARALRGVLGGHPEELASIIPFSDTMGITDEANRVSGEDLLKKAGVLEGEGEKGTFELRDLLGPALEIGLDPATYATFGASALGRGGQIAKAIGKAPATAAERLGTLGEVLGKEGGLAGELGQRAAQYASGRGWDLAEHLNQPMGGLMGLGLPFSDPMATFGSKGALEGLQSLGKGIRNLPGIKQAADFSAPYRSALTRLLDPSVMKMAEPELQEAARKVYTTRQAAEPGIQRSVGEVASKLTPEELSGQQLRYAREQPGVTKTLGGMDISTGAREAATMAGGKLDESFKMLADKGLDNTYYPNYFSRQQTVVPGQQYAKGYRPKGLFDVGDPAREEILKGIPGETETINRMKADPKIFGPNRLSPADAGEYIRRTYLGGAASEDIIKQARGIANMMADYSEEWKGLPQEGKEFFGNQPIGEFERGLQRAADKGARLDVFHPMGAEMAMPRNQIEGEAVTLKKFLEDAKAKDPKLNTLETSNAMRRSFDELASRKTNPIDLKTLYQTDPEKAVEAWNDLYIPKRYYDDVIRASKPFEAPEAIKPFLKLWDSATNLIKAGQTAMWPAKYMRDAVTGAYQNWVHGAFGANATADAAKLHFGGEIAPERLAKYGAKDINDLKIQVSADNIGRSGGLNRQIVGGEDAAQEFMERYAGNKSIVPEGLNWNPLAQGSRPWDVAGVGGRTETGFAPAAVGYNIGNRIFDVNETAAYLKKLEDGFNHEAAAKVAKDAQFKWGQGSMTDFEKSVMRRVIPYYSWIKQNVPSQVRQLFEHPGGKVAQSIRGESDFSQKQGFLPDYLQGTLAIPAGSEKEGTQRFLTAGGLPFEELGSFVGGGPNRLQSVLQELGSQANPMLKAPVELATGKQLYSGRDLSDLYSRTGLGQPWEELIQNSPVGRLMNAVGPGGTLFDPRKDLLTKGINLGTGIKLSDIDMAKQRNIEAQNLLDELLRGKPEVGNIQRFYAKPGAELSKDEMELLRLQATLEKEFREKRKAGTK